MKKLSNTLKIITAILTFAPLFATAQTLLVGIEGEYPPFSEVNDAGELIGFDVDIANAICAAMQRDCTLVQTSWDALIPSLNTRKIDIVVASMSATPERKNSVDFTDKYYSSNGRFVLRDAQAQQFTDDNFDEFLKGKILGVQRTTVHDHYASAELADKVDEILRYNTQDEVNLDLIAGRVDLTLADQVALITGFLNLDDGKGYSFAAPVINDKRYYGEGIAITLRKGEQQLKEEINKAIQTIRADGTYATINDKYFNIDIY